MNYGNNMDPDIEKLIQLFKKILKKHPQEAEHLSKIFDSKSINLNLCFLAFVPMSEEEVGELNEIYEDALSRSEDALQHDLEHNLEFRLTNGDLDFLKKNGIQF
ncbi:MAG: hypothetical protein A3J52_01850 [Omnitrophica bacterium RIFCSPHIGHO2_02_FULL_49_9]|nr:MAG: hypothetical protein A3J52_01850 [Omnitrophica bacterium RIFCSPHIGHO2_02_FULL_49_9]